MYIEDIKTGERFEAVIRPLTDIDFVSIKKDAGFVFDWTKCKGKELFKLTLLYEEKILGLLCMSDHPYPMNVIEIELLEVRNEHVGSKKRLNRIAGCLIAFACRESIKRRHEAYIILVPKTKLIKHYSARYFLEYTGKSAGQPAGLMAADDKKALRLIREYL